MRVLVMLDGTVLDASAPQLPVTDLGLLRGDGVFETILVTGGVPREFDAHLDRLATSAAALDLPQQDRRAWRDCVEKLCGEWTVGPDFALRLIYTRGDEQAGRPTAFALASDPPAPGPSSVSMVTLRRPVAEDAPWLLLGAKSLSYAMNMAALREANRRGADDAVFVDDAGHVLEGPRSSVVTVREGVLRTPPEHAGILPGTTQAALYRAARTAGWTVRTEPIPRADLFTADAVLLTSSLRRIVAVDTLDGEPLPDASTVRAELVELYEQQYR